MGSANSADVCNRGENGTLGTATGCDDSVAVEADRVRPAVGLVIVSDRDDRRLFGLGVFGDWGSPLAGERASSRSGVVNGDRAGREGTGAPGGRVDSVARDPDNCAIDSNDDFSDSSDWSSDSARLFIWRVVAMSEIRFGMDSHMRSSRAHLADRVARVDQLVMVVVDERLPFSVELSDLCAGEHCVSTELCEPRG